VQTSASRLLAATAIWSTEATPRPPAPPPAPVETRAPEPVEPIPAEPPAPARMRPRASEIMAAFKSASSSDRRASEPTLVPATPAARARKLSLALQGGGSLSAFTWGVLDRLLEAPDFQKEQQSFLRASASLRPLTNCGMARSSATLTFVKRTIQRSCKRSGRTIPGKIQN